ncbi:Hypothetical predicted protein [Mytilus galloprovincialis]|uniref:Uncharacterized protein n=1 Tax=Mytilus galloprovincialis TaxID=29158 RepID=A0A8B6G7F0_MYTGA|nr:Hypothetical predicted protein [Mytilus galloprovincialis]
MVTLILVIAIISIRSFRQIRIYKEQLRRVNEMLPGTEFSTYTGIEVNNEEVNDSGYNELAVNTPRLLADCHENEIDPADEEMDYLVPEQHYHTIPEVEVHYAEACVEEHNVD